MNTHADKTQDNKSQSVANMASHKLDSGESRAPLVDNRPEAIAHQKLQKMANNSPQANKAAQLQSMANNNSAKQQQTIQKKDNSPELRRNNTGLPDNLKSGIENLSGYSMDDVKVHYHSDKPAQLQAHAFAQGTDIHLGSGQEKHLPHEAWHVVQQKQGRVKPTMQMKGKVNINDDPDLESEADFMGAKAANLANKPSQALSNFGEKSSFLQGVFQTKSGVLSSTSEEFSAKGIITTGGITSKDALFGAANLIVQRIAGRIKREPDGPVVQDLASGETYEISDSSERYLPGDVVDYILVTDSDEVVRATVKRLTEAPPFTREHVGIVAADLGEGPGPWRGAQMPPEVKAFMDDSHMQTVIKQIIDGAKAIKKSLSAEAQNAYDDGTQTVPVRQQTMLRIWRSAGLDIDYIMSTVRASYEGRCTMISGAQGVAFYSTTTGKLLYTIHLGNSAFVGLIPAQEGQRKVFAKKGSESDHEKQYIQDDSPAKNITARFVTRAATKEQILSLASTGMITPRAGENPLEELSKRFVIPPGAPEEILQRYRLFLQLRAGSGATQLMLSATATKKAIYGNSGTGFTSTPDFGAIMTIDLAKMPPDHVFNLYASAAKEAMEGLPRKRLSGDRPARTAEEELTSAKASAMRNREIALTCIPLHAISIQNPETGGACNEQGFQNLVDSIKREKEAQAQIPVEESQWQRNRNHRRAFDRLIKVWNEESATAYADSISNKLQTGSVDDWNKGMIEALLAKINELAGAEK
jgi:hypothetical protein